MYDVIKRLLSAVLLLYSVPSAAVVYAPFWSQNRADENRTVRRISVNGRFRPQSFVVWRENIDMRELLESSFEMAVVDDDFKDGAEYLFTKDWIDRLKKRGKILLCIFNPLKADRKRFYRRDARSRYDNSGRALPDWLGEAVEDGEGAHAVDFWKRSWLDEVVKPYLNKIIERGFDGIYLEGINLAASYDDGDSDAQIRVAQQAKAFLKLLEEIAAYLHAIDPEFRIVVEGAADLLPYDTQGILSSVIDGVATQSLFFNGTRPNYSSRQRLKRLRILRAKGVSVFVIDYLDSHRRYEGENKARFKRFRNRLRQERFIGYGAYSDRKLDRISAISEVIFAGADDKDRDYIPDHLDDHPNQPAMGRRENSFFESFHLGIGGRPALPFRAEYSANPIWISMTDIVFGMNWTQKQPLYAIDDGEGDPVVEEFDRLREEMGIGHVKFLTIWVTRGWQEQWYDLQSLQKALDGGLVLVVNYAFFMDELAKPAARERVRKLAGEYERSSRRLGLMLGKLQGDILIVMEPEFNKRNILKWQQFPELIRRNGIQVVREHAAKVKPGRVFFFRKPKKRRIFFGIAVTDTGSRDTQSKDRMFGRKSLGDSRNWRSFHTLLKPLVDDLDFIAFQEMVGSFSRDPYRLERVRRYTAEELGMVDIDRRIENFTAWLHRRYHQPVLLSYIALATGTWDDKDKDRTVDAEEVDPLGWVDIVADAYEKISRRYRSYESAGLFGLAPMMLFDNPSHDIGKFQYFDRNEYTLGLIATDAVPGVNSPLGGHWIYKKRKGAKRNIVETIFDSVDTGE